MRHKQQTAGAGGQGQLAWAHLVARHLVHFTLDNDENTLPLKPQALPRVLFCLHQLFPLCAEVVIVTVHDIIVAKDNLFTVLLLCEVFACMHDSQTSDPLRQSSGGLGPGGQANRS
jgi:hypothetical protein